MTEKERIANGECVSPMTVDRCPYCIDTCKASEARSRMREAKRLLSVNKVKVCTDEGRMMILKERGNDDTGYIEQETSMN